MFKADYWTLCDSLFNGETNVAEGGANGSARQQTSDLYFFCEAGGHPTHVCLLLVLPPPPPTCKCVEDWRSVYQAALWMLALLAVNRPGQRYANLGLFTSSTSRESTDLGFAGDVYTKPSCPKWLAQLYLSFVVCVSHSRSLNFFLSTSRMSPTHRRGNCSLDCNR